MSKIACWIAMVSILLGLTFMPSGALAEPSLDRKTMELVDSATFEVVVRKPTKDSLSYEKPLPFDLLPYAVRTDAYYSLGTAFAIAPDRFVSADHVLSLGVESQFKEFFLRDKDGNVYPIDKIFKYSDRRDFVVFSLKGKKSGRFFDVNTQPEMNGKVFAVGNALGQGIVVRDGLYTSNTPEEEEGEWKWLRFSAAASPGNSGGPLLDSDGKVIGIVLQKSANENLNIALPIAEVLKAQENRAVSRKKMKYFLDNMDMNKMDTFSMEVPLPKAYQELNHELIDGVNVFAGRLLKGLLAENRENIFPMGKGSEYILHKNYTAIFPHLIMKGEDGSWDFYSPKETSRSELGTNGHLTYGSIGNSLYIKVQKPDDIPLDKFYNDSKTFMDLLLKGITVSRRVGPEKVKVVSMGKADKESVFIDGYGRKWLVRTWVMEYSDEKIVTFSLPVPGGCVTMLRGGQTDRVEYGHIPDLKALTDFIYVSYYGSFKQWREFLENRDLLPGLFAGIDMTFDYNRRFSYKSKRLSISYGPELMQITEKSDLKLNIGYFRENGKILWDVVDITPGDDKSNGTCFTIDRNARPPEEMSDSFRSDWENLVHRRMPYDKVSFFKDKSTAIATVYTKNAPAKGLDAAAVLYNVGYMRDGNFDQKEMEAKLDKFMENLSVLEGAGGGSEQHAGN